MNKQQNSETHQVCCDDDAERKAETEWRGGPALRGLTAPGRASHFRSCAGERWVLFPFLLRRLHSVFPAGPCRVHVQQFITESLSHVTDWTDLAHYVSSDSRCQISEERRQVQSCRSQTDMCGGLKGRCAEI